MPLTPDQVEGSINEARHAIETSNFGLADFICQRLVEQEAQSPELVFLLAQVAAGIGEFATARAWFERGADAMPDAAAQSLGKLREQERLAQLCMASAPRRQRFHLIKAWGFGLTSDIDHVLGHLLLAEITHRVPIIHWGSNSLFRDPQAENAWTQFFEPVSPFSIRDVLRAGVTFFPGKWSIGNIHIGELNKLRGPGSKTAGVLYLNQPADVTIGDFCASPIELLPWVYARVPPHPLAMVHHLQIEQAYRYAVDKHLRPKPHIAAAVDQFAAEHFQNRSVLAVHVRGSDKITETSALPDAQRSLYAFVQADMERAPDQFIFLLTDDAAVAEYYRQAFPGRIITTDCTRTSTPTGLHYQSGSSPAQLGFEVLRDAYLAARCERFFGLGCTNVSNLVLHLRPWPHGAVQLIGPVMHYQRHLLFAD